MVAVFNAKVSFYWCTCGSCKMAIVCIHILVVDSNDNENVFC